MISESVKHDVNAVYQFQQMLIDHIKNNFTFIKKLYFFSDGAGGRYKNKKNFYNISQYKAMYNLDVEWQCFATLHGKSPCNGIGGTFKRNARRASIQRINNPIANAKELYEWAKSNKESSMEFMFSSQEDYDKIVNDTHDRYDNLKTIAGTQGLHTFIPCADGEILVKRYSECPHVTKVRLLQ